MMLALTLTLLLPLPLPLTMPMPSSPPRVPERNSVPHESARGIPTPGEARVRVTANRSLALPQVRGRGYG